jgi:hypothetical protein
VAFLDVGDEVAREIRGRLQGIYRIDRITPTQIVVGQERFDKETRRKIGQQRWDDCSIRPVNQTDRDAIEFRDTLQRVRHALEHKPTLDQLRRIAAILDEEKEGKP